MDVVTLQIFDVAVRNFGVQNIVTSVPNEATASCHTLFALSRMELFNVGNEV